MFNDFFFICWHSLCLFVCEKNIWLGFFLLYFFFSVILSWSSNLLFFNNFCRFFFFLECLLIFVDVLGDCLVVKDDLCVLFNLLLCCSFVFCLFVAKVFFSIIFPDLLSNACWDLLTSFVFVCERWLYCVCYCFAFWVRILLFLFLNSFFAVFLIEYLFLYER